VGLKESAARALFEVYDTDKNGLVDSYEVLASLAFASMVPMEGIIEFIFGIYDFNGSGDLAKDEVTMLFRTVQVGCAKIDLDESIHPQPIEVLEALAARAFTLADKDHSGAITCEEFSNYMEVSSMAQNFIKCAAVVEPACALPPPPLQPPRRLLCNNRPSQWFPRADIGMVCSHTPTFRMGSCGRIPISRRTVRVCARCVRACAL
jgi:Ca2+-binding EF-hand superfamily protein